MLTTCPKCGHTPLPDPQTAFTTCPGCGAYLAKLASGPLRDRDPHLRHRTTLRATGPGDDESGLASLLLHVPARVDPQRWWLRAVMLAVFTVWGWNLIAMDYRDGSIAASFLHRPLLIFHEAGHVIFMPLGEWMAVAGGSLFQLILPGVLCGALLLKTRDPFGAAIGLWLLGVSLLDLAPYIYDAFDPQLTLLGGGTGQDGPHDWLYLLRTMGLREKAQVIGAVVHKLGALVMILSMVWGAWVLKRQRARVSDAVFFEET